MRRSTVLLLIAILGGMFLRFYKLGAESLWYDETYTWFCTQLSWIGMLELLRNPGGEVPLFYAGVKLITDLAGSDTEWHLRLLSALAGIVGILFAAMTGRVAAGKIGMLAAGWFWAFHPMAVWYSRDVKTYSLAAALAAILFYSYLQLWRDPDRRLILTAFLALTAGYLSHFFFFALNGGLILVAMSNLRDKAVFFRRWVLLSLIAAVPLILWLIWYIVQPEPYLGSGWIQRPDWNDPLETIWNLLSGYAGRYTLATTLFGFLALIAALFGLSVKNQTPPPVPVALLGIGAPLIGVWVVSQRRPLYIDRYFIVLLPLVAWLVAIGARRIVEIVQSAGGKIKGANAILIACLAVGLISAPVAGWQSLTASHLRREDWRGLSADLDRLAPNSATIWFQDDVSIIPLRYYYPDEFQPVWSEQPPVCTSPCWWVLRQPFTDTHAFTQSVNLTNRHWLPALPPGCRQAFTRDYQTGIMLWEVACNDS